MLYNSAENYKYIASDCKNLLEMSEVFQTFAEELKNMQNDGIKVENIDAPWFYIETDDLELAKKYNLRQYCENCEEEYSLDEEHNIELCKSEFECYG